jgi:hypothetical protein
MTGQVLVIDGGADAIHRGDRTVAEPARHTARQRLAMLTGYASARLRAGRSASRAG